MYLEVTRKKVFTLIEIIEEFKTGNLEPWI